jgi:hypothetical protein
MLRQSVYSPAGSGVGRGVLRHAAITVHTSKAHEVNQILRNFVDKDVILSA